MWLYRASAQSIAGDPYLLANLESDYQARHVSGSAAGPGDVRAWRRSVTHLAQELRDCGLGQVFMFIEYELDSAQTGEPFAPIDVVLAGVKPGTDEPSYVAVELKQWSDVDPVEGHPEKVYVPQYRRAKPHPAAQVDRNRRQLLKHLDVFADGYVGLRALAYLHNLNSESTQWITNHSPSAVTTVITGRTPHSLREYLLEHLSTVNDGSAAAAAAQRLSQSRVLSSSPLQAVFGALLDGRADYNLFDEQRVAFDHISRALSNPSGATQDVFLVEGRPGTGKSVLAVCLLKWAIEHNRSCLYVSGGTASRATFQKNSPGHGKLFISLKKLADEYPPKSVDIIVVDEAHRLSEYPLLNNTGALRPGEETIDVVLSRARVPVFFIDEDQRVRPNEIVSARQIETHAREIPGVNFVPYILARPLRGAGSPTYDTWVRRLLAGPRPEPLKWQGADPFELALAESPSAMEQLLRDRQAEGDTARMTAGFCWKWSPPRADGTLVDDVRIGGWHRPWNAKRRTAAANVPPSLLWATAPGGFEQLGCVYTAQGLEYDWAGIIFGDDLVWRDGTWKAVPEASRDGKLKSKSKTHEDFAQSVRNAYTVLLTRAMRGAFVYSTDPLTQAFLRELIA
jgi:DUF2075 family protein